MIKILDYTTKTPLQMIGYCAGVCWNSPLDNVEKNIKRAKSCIASGHGRVAEYPDVYMIIDGYSARAIRELYTHIIGTTRLQSSTRYVDAKSMDVESEFFYPPKLTEQGKQIYKKALNDIMESYRLLEDDGLTKEDAANLLPLGMHSKIVFKINLRALIHLANMRLCTRAYHEIRSMLIEMKKELSCISDEWAWICDSLLVPKCESTGYCDEDHSCGRKPKGIDGIIRKAREDFAKELQKRGIIDSWEKVID